MFSRLCLTVLQACYRAQSRCRLPAYKGSLFRGALGHALRSLGCRRSGSELCERCRDPVACPYGAMFEPLASEAATGSDCPRPYVLAPPAEEAESYRAGDVLSLQVTLVGTAGRWAAEVGQALADLGRRGLGVERSRWHMERLRVEGPVETWKDAGAGRWPQVMGQDLLARHPAQATARLRFLTPAHLKQAGQVVYRPNAEILFRRLLRRLGSLLELYCAELLTERDYRSLLDAATGVRLEAEGLEVKRWKRFSSRHNEQHPLSGFVGAVLLHGVPEALWPCLVLGQRLHVGNGASFGMGRYEIVPS